MGRPNPAEQLRIASRRSKVAELTLRGVNQWEICTKLGMEPDQRTIISKDVAVIRKEWRQSAIRDFDEARGRELAALDAVEKEFWEAWERSKTEKESKRTAKRTHPRGEDNSDETIKECRDGNPAFLDGVLKCITKRCEILGLDVPPDGSQSSDKKDPMKVVKIIERYSLEFERTAERQRIESRVSGNGIAEPLDPQGTNGQTIRVPRLSGP